MSIETHTIGAFTYLDADCLSTGDYGGAGSVGAANQKYIDALIEAKEYTSADFYFSHQEELIADGHLTLNAGYKNGEWKYEVEPFTGADVLIFSGGYGRSMWVRADCDLAEDVNALADYPCFDDELVSEVETEWESEAWDSWVMHDLTRNIDDDLAGKAERLADEDKLFPIYRQAMEDTNTYPVPEYSSTYIDVDAIQETFTELLGAA